MSEPLYVNPHHVKRVGVRQDMERYPEEDHFPVERRPDVEGLKELWRKAKAKKWKP